MLIWIAHVRSGAALGMLAVLVVGCGVKEPRIVAATETEAALCDAWALSVPTRSAEDTEQTQTEVGRAYDILEAVCGAGSVEAGLSGRAGPSGGGGG